MNTLMVLLQTGTIYRSGGVMFMHPLSLLFIVNIIIIGYVIAMRAGRKEISLRWIEAIRHIANLAAVFGVFSTLIGLFFAFSALESSAEIIPFPVISGGLKVSLITVLYGLIIFMISYSFYIVLKATHKTSAAKN
jgi:hypothetical protein